MPGHSWELQNINPSKTRSKLSIPESSIIAKSSGHHDKIIQVSDSTIPQTMLESDSNSRTIKRKDMHDTRRKIPAYADPIHKPPKPIEISLQVIPRKLMDVDTDTLEEDINMDFEEISPYQEGVISETYQRPDKSYFQEPSELQGLVSTGKLVQSFFLPKQAAIDKI